MACAGAPDQTNRSVTRVTGTAAPKREPVFARATASIASAAASREGGAPSSTIHWPETRGTAQVAPMAISACRAARSAGSCTQPKAAGPSAITKTIARPASGARPNGMKDSCGFSARRTSRLNRADTAGRAKASLVIPSAVICRLGHCAMKVARGASPLPGGQTSASGGPCPEGCRTGQSRCGPGFRDSGRAPSARKERQAPSTECRPSSPA